MMATLSWPPLKNSGRLSVAMRGSKLLIFEYDGDGPKAKGPECPERPLNIAVSGYLQNRRRKFCQKLTVCLESSEEKRIANAGEERARYARTNFLVNRCRQTFEGMTTVLIVLLSLIVGVLVGLLGIGGGVVLVPALTYLLHYDQHLAQGTSLLILLPPIGLGALREYWKNGQVDLRAGIYSALGFLIGGYGGGKIAVPMPSNILRMIFGCFLMMSAVLLWRKTRAVNLPDPADAGSPKENALRALGIFCTAGFCGVAAGRGWIRRGVVRGALVCAGVGGWHDRRRGGRPNWRSTPTGGLGALAVFGRGDTE